MAIEFLSPVGRLVQGDPMEAQTTDMQGQPLVVKTGPNAGQPAIRYFVAVAFAKNDPAWPAFHAKIDSAARTGFPQLFGGNGQAPTCSHPNFSWKIMDGDGIDANGINNATKEGFSGHWIVKFSSSFPPKCFHKDRYDPAQQIQNKGEIKRGYYVRIAGTTEGNNNPQRPGVYVNLNMVELTAYGAEITSGPDARAIFSGAPVAALPAGAMAAPMGAPPLPTAPGVAVGAPPLPTASALPTAVVTPNHAFVTGATGALPPLPAAGPVYTMLPAAQGHTREEFLAQGYTDEQLIAANFMARS